MKKTLGIGVVGLGNISGYHIRSIKELPKCKFLTVTSRQREKREKAEHDHKVKAYSELDDMLKHPDLDAVIICSPSGYHLEQTQKIAKSGKHVIVEKPLDVTIKRAKAMIDVCRENNVTLSCIFQNRFSDDYQKLYRAVQKEEFGKLILANAYIKWFRNKEYYDSSTWKGKFVGEGGAALINQSIHTIDLMLNTMGKVKNVFGQIRTLVHEIEGEDLGVGIVEFENGALGTIEGSTSVYQGFPEKLEIHGSEGSVILEGGKIVHWNSKRRGRKKIEVETGKSGSANPLAIGYELHKKQLDLIAKALLKGQQPPVSGDDAIKSIEVIELIYKSSKSGKKIHLL